MRKLVLLLVVLGLTSSLWAADPIIGTWKLNLAKSRFGANPQGPPKEGMEIYRELPGNQIELTYTRTLADGSSALFKAQWPAQGGVLKILGERDSQTESYIETVIDPGNWYVTVLQDGIQVGVLYKAVSKDGRTMTQTFKAAEGPIKRIISVPGEDDESIVIFDKQ